MRILMVSHTESAWTPPFARFFVARGDTVLVVSISPATIEGVDSAFVGVEPFDEAKNKHLFFTCVPRIRRIICRFRPDLVFAIYLSSNGLSAALSWRGPLAVSAVGGDVQNRAGRTGVRLWLRESVIRFVASRADIINTVSQGLDNELTRLGVSASKLLRIPFGVDLEKFVPGGDTPREGATRLICTRRHEPVYDIPTVLNALVRLKAAGRSFRCVFTSSGPHLDRHRALAKAFGLADCATFTGDVEYDALPDLLRQAEIYVSASLSDGTSVALLEAMASGLLPVVSDIEANRPWVHHGRTGLLFEPGRADYLAQMLELAMDDAELRGRASGRNRSRIEADGDAKRNMERLAAAFDRLVAERRR